MNQKHIPWLRLLGVALILFMGLAAACAPAPTATPTEAEHEHEAEGEGEHEHSGDTIPNDGAVVRIVSPADGETITGNEIEVKIETENFALGEDGRHWHVYLDGEEVSMVTGGDSSYVVHGIAAGEHEVKVTLANGDHQELEDGSTINITVSG